MRNYISLSSDFSSEPCARNLRLETPYQILGHFSSDPCARDYRLQTPSAVFSHGEYTGIYVVVRIHLHRHARPPTPLLDGPRALHHFSAIDYALYRGWSE
jgi:hypothetical protein